MQEVPLKHSTSISDKLTEVCSALFENCPLTTFGYIKILDSGELLHLSTNKQWLEHCYTSQVFDSPEYVSHLLREVKLGKFHYFMKTGVPKEGIESSQYKFNFWNSLIIAHRVSNYIELFAFHSSTFERPFDIYLNQSHTFKKFALHFVDQFHNIINVSDTKTFQKPDKLLLHSKSLFKGEERGEGACKFTEDKVTVKRLYLNNRSSYLTARQAQCISLLMQAKNSKEIARALGISFRTVEGLLDLSKRVLGVSSKSQLVSAVLDSDLQDIFIKSLNVAE